MKFKPPKGRQSFFKDVVYSSIFIFLFSLPLLGCAGIDVTPTQSALGGGAVTGAVAVKTIEKVKEIFTPKYPLLVKSIEICDLTLDDKVKCFLVPCSNEDVCVITRDKEEWIEENPKVITMRTSSLPAIRAFCLHNEKACEEMRSEYEGYKIIIMED